MDIEQLIYTGTILLISIMLYVIVHYLVKQGSVTKRLRENNNTYILTAFSYVKYIYFLIISLILLQLNGVNVSAMLAGLGIAGVVIGLAVQDALKDIIRGINIISEGYFKVGDVVKYGDIIGEVIELRIKTTKIRDIYSDNIVSLANRNIEKVEMLTKTINLNVPMSYDVSLKDAEKCMTDMVKDVLKIEGVDEAEYRGVTELAKSCVEYRLYVGCNPLHRVPIRRKVLRQILVTLDKHNIKVPYEQLDVHTKKN